MTDSFALRERAVAYVEREHPETSTELTEWFADEYVDTIENGGASIRKALPGHLWAVLDEADAWPSDEML